MAPESACTSSGSASVAKSRSAPSRPMIASRTLPPTRYSSWPASANTSPRPRSDVGVPVQRHRGCRRAARHRKRFQARSITLMRRMAPRAPARGARVKSHASYYRLGVGRRKGKIAAAPGSAPGQACLRCAGPHGQEPLADNEAANRARRPAGPATHRARDLGRRVGGRRPGRSRRAATWRR